MKSRIILLGLMVVASCTSVSFAARIPAKDLKAQDEIFQQWWNTNLETKFDALPANGAVTKDRMPYSGFIYPDKTGGTASALRRYDWAFYRGRGMASNWERRDIEATKDTVSRRGGFGFFGGGRMITRRDTPDWAGHCNGWTAAAIRHAEPQVPVRRNGVTFTPADIKGLLAELYVYSDSVNLAGDVGTAHPAMFHLIMTNWLGKGQHPLGADIAMGKEVWNYPIYAYKSSAERVNSRLVEVKMNIGYVYMLNQEMHKAPKNYRFKRFHYMLELDTEGRIVGGYYLNGSSKLDLVWVPLQPKQGGKPGNRNGCPYLKADEVLAIWRASVPEERRMAWWNIDPTPADAIIEPEAPAAEAIVEEAPATEETETANAAEAIEAETNSTTPPTENNDSQAVGTGVIEETTTVTEAG